MYGFSMIVQDLNYFVILKIKDIDYRCYIVGIDKKDAISLLSNSVPDNKGVL